ncbi:DUF7344 domain-containing protein [Halostella litorea]|uniref:DUF7344 domain-containing protein n=1 Tax=Halostella litorea TaxID=2528831 RepID=UPI001091BAD7|nr:hypothetical protein [Halostella litorea]
MASVTSDGTDTGSDGAEAADPLSKTDIFDVLRNQRRRFVLQYLKRHETPVELGDLATQVAAWEYDTTPDGVTSAQRKRVYTTLQQTHLPRMDEVGIVAYDADEGTIERTDATADLTVYLEIVPGNEFAWRELYLSLGAVSLALVAALWGDVYPLTVLSDLVWATLIAAVVTVSAVAHVYHERHMRLGQQEAPPELDYDADD